MNSNEPPIIPTQNEDDQDMVRMKIGFFPYFRPYSMPEIIEKYNLTESEAKKIEILAKKAWINFMGHGESS